MPHTTLNTSNHSPETKENRTNSSASSSAKPPKVSVRPVPREIVDRIGRVEKTVAERGFIQTIIDSYN